MTISPEKYYEEYLRGRSQEDIMRRIRSLKREISRLKREAESNEPKCHLMPDPQPQLMLCREYLKVAKLAYKEAGGIYVPTKAEIRDVEYEESLESLSKLTFVIGGPFEGYELQTFTISGKDVLRELKQSGFRKPREPQACKTFTKDEFLSGLKDIHMGEWKSRYVDKGYVASTQWKVEILYSKGRKPFRVSGERAYPYNFDELTDFLGSDGRKRVLSIFRDRGSGEYMLERSIASVPEFVKKDHEEQWIKHRKECHMFDWVLIRTKDEMGEETADILPLFHLNPDGWLRFNPYFAMEPYRLGDDPEEDKKIRRVLDHWGVEM